VSSRYRRDLEPSKVDPLVRGHLQDLAADRPSGSCPQPARYHDQRATGDCTERRQVEVIGVPVRDDDDIHVAEDLEVGRRAVPDERPELGAQEWIGQDPHPTDLDQHRRVADEAQIEVRSIHGRRVSRR